MNTQQTKATELLQVHCSILIARDWTAPFSVSGSSPVPSVSVYAMGKFSLMPVDVFPLVACMTAGAN